MNLGLLVALEITDKVISKIQRIFNTGPYGDPPLKIKISKIGLRHVLSWFKMGLEPKFGGGDKKIGLKLVNGGPRVLGIKECDA